jgi:hypothetical protein
MKWMTGLGMSALFASAAWTSGAEQAGPAPAGRGGGDHAEIVLVARGADGETWRARTVVTARGVRSTIDEQVVLAPDGRLLHGFLQLAVPGRAVTRRWYEPALAAVIVEEDGVVARESVPDDAPWVVEPLTVGGAPALTRLGAWATYRATTASPATTSAPLVRVVGRGRVPSDQLVVATERGPLVVAGDAAAPLDARFFSGRFEGAP